MVKLFNLFKAAEPEREIRTIKIKQMSTTGTLNYSGYTAEEYLSTLRNSRLRADVYDKMRRSDPQIKMLLRAVKSPLLGANYEIMPYEQGNKDFENDAEIVRFILMEAMEKSWIDFLSEMYTFIDFGHSVFERVDKIVQHQEFGQLVGIKNLSFIGQRTIDRWNLYRETNQLKSVTQLAHGDLSSMAEIPAEFLTVFTLEKEGSNYEGVSAIRSCYGNYYRKNIYLKLNAIGVEKFAIPTPVVNIPTGKESGEQYDNLISALEAYCTHEKAYMTIPEGFTIDFKTNTYDPQKVETSIDNEDKRMVKSFLANFLELGINGAGSQSLSFDLSDFFLGSIEYMGKIFCDNVNRCLIPQIIKMNRGERVGYPYMKMSGISDKVGVELSQTMQNLVNAKIITPDEQLEKHVRERYNLPEVDEESRRELPEKDPKEKEDPEEDPDDEKANPLLFERLKKMYRG